MSIRTTGDITPSTPACPLPPNIISTFPAHGIVTARSPAVHQSTLAVGVVIFLMALRTLSATHPISIVDPRNEGIQ